MIVGFSYEQMSVKETVERRAAEITKKPKMVDSVRPSCRYCQLDVLMRSDADIEVIKGVLACLCADERQ